MLQKIQKKTWYHHAFPKGKVMAKSEPAWRGAPASDGSISSSLWTTATMKMMMKVMAYTLRENEWSCWVLCQWKMLKDVERCWKMLKDVETCWNMLKDVEICWNMLKRKLDVFFCLVDEFSWCLQSIQFAICSGIFETAFWCNYLSSSYVTNMLPSQPPREQALGAETNWSSWKCNST